MVSELEEVAAGGTLGEVLVVLEVGVLIVIRANHHGLEESGG